MRNEAGKEKKPYVQPQIEVREGFEKNVLQSGCAVTGPNPLVCPWVGDTG